MKSEQEGVWQAEADLYTFVDRLAEMAQCYGMHDLTCQLARENLLRAIDIYGKACEAHATAQWLLKMERALA